MVRLGYLTVFVALAIAFSCLQAAGTLPNPYVPTYRTNITITQLSIPSNVGIYSPLPIFFNITNTGAYASGNIVISMQIYGTPEVNRTFNFSGLSSGQSRLVLVYVNNATSVTGGRTVYLSSEYTMDGSMYQTGKAVGGYKVLGSGFAEPVSLYGGTGSLIDTKIDTIPLTVCLIGNSSLLSQMTFSYNGSRPATIDITVPSIFSQILSFSTSSVYMQNNQSLSPSILFTPIKQAYGSTYIIPISFTEAQNNGPKSQETRYIQVSTLNTTGNMPVISERVSLLDNGASSTGIVQVNSPANYSLYGSELEMTLPSSVTASASSIDAYGAQANVTQKNGSYIVLWNLGDLQKNQVIYLYYDISGLLNPGALINPQLLLSSNTRAVQSSNFNITGTVLPVFYVNSTEQIQINMVYTGSEPTRAVFYLPSTSSINVQNATHVISVTPNQQLEQTFLVTAKNYTGTALLKLYVVAGGINSTYNLPVIILQKPTDLPSLILYFFIRFDYEILVIIVLICAMYIYAVQRRRRPKKYDPESTQQIIALRDQISKNKEAEQKSYGEIKSTADLEGKNRKTIVLIHSEKALANITQTRKLRFMGGNQVAIFKIKEFVAKKEDGGEMKISIEKEGRVAASPTERELLGYDEVLVIGFIRDKDKSTWTCAIVLKSPKGDFGGMGDLHVEKD